MSSSPRFNACNADSSPHCLPFWITSNLLFSAGVRTKMSSTPNVKPICCKNVVNNLANADNSKPEVFPLYS